MMECNKDEAFRAKEIAEKKFLAKDLEGAKKFALKAQQLFPTLEGIGQLIATIDVYIASEIKISGEKDWYAILNVNAAADEETVKKQFRKLALLLHPDKNKSVGADGAFKLISEAWSLLSDKSRRSIYDTKRNNIVSQHKTSRPSTEKMAQTTGTGFSNVFNSATSKAHTQKSSSDATAAAARASHPLKSGTFWTSCKRCKIDYEYMRIYLNSKILCPNCQELFLADEIPMANRQNSSEPQSASRQQPSYSCQNFANKTAYTSGGHNSVPAGMAPSMSQTGENAVNPGSYPGQNFQWGPFTGKAGTASATASSAAAAQTVRHQAYEKVKKEREDLQAKKELEELQASVEAALKKKSTLKRNTGTSDSLAAKRRKGSTDDARDGKGGFSTKELHETKMERMSGASGNLNRFRTSGRQYNSGREFAKMDVRPMLIEMTKLSMTKKLEEWTSSVPVKAPELEKAKKGRSMGNNDRVKVDRIVKAPETENAKKGISTDHNDGVKIDRMVHGDAIDHESSEGFTAGPEKCVTEKIAPTAKVSNSDSNTDEQVITDVPDSDFHDFDKDRTELSFETDQLWATYDEEDSMPRYYALIRKIISLKPFKVSISFLSSKSNSEFGPMKWVAAGFPKSCGDFRIGRSRTYDTVNIFSHKVIMEKGLHGVVKIFPRKGQVWALYRNWSVNWDENTPDEVLYKYDMVEVLNEYSEDQGISVAPLVKAAGFRTVFRRHQDPNEVRQIQKQEMFRFSHQVPSYTLTGEEAENAPKGFYELDPAATPTDLLQVITET